jgi:glutathione reductase (NADPH)
MQQCDVIVIGTGTAGQTAAQDLAASGYQVMVIEQSMEPGGVCSLHGCQAKKFFYEVAEAVARCRHLAGRGIVMQPTASWSDIQKAKNEFTAKIPEATVRGLRGSGIEYITGSAAFVDSATVEVNGQSFSADSFIIACGARPASLPFEGAEYLVDSNTFLSLDGVPPRIVFVGGGFISFEFAHFAARLGSTPSEIHIVEAAERPLAGFDADMVEQLVAASAQDGIRVHVSTAISGIERHGAGYAVSTAGGRFLEADMVVHGAGRMAAIDSLNLESAGIAYSPSGIEVGRDMRTSRSTIFAVGDCAASIQLARVADREAAVAAANIKADLKGGERAEIDYRPVPATLFTYPQLSMVGETEEQLLERGVKYWKSFDTNLGWPTYRRVGLRHAAYKILVDEHDRVLGAHVLSDNTTGVINVFKQAMIDDTDIGKLRDDHIMSPYPSRESDIVYMLNPLLE